MSVQEGFLVLIRILSAPIIPPFFPRDFSHTIGNDLSVSCQAVGSWQGWEYFPIHLCPPQLTHWGTYARCQTNKGLKLLSRSPGQKSPMEYRRPWVPDGSNTYSGSHVLLAGPTFITSMFFFSPKMLKQKLRGKETHGSPLDDFPYCL